MVNLCHNFFEIWSLGNVWLKIFQKTKFFCEATNQVVIFYTVPTHISQHHISQQFLTFRNTFWTLKICEMWSENSLTFRNTILTLRISEMWSVPELRIEIFQNIRNTSIPILYNSIPIRAPVQYLI